MINIDDIDDIDDIIDNWFSDGFVGGKFDSDGYLDLYFDDEFSDSDKYSLEVQNGDGYYDINGNFVRDSLFID